MAWTCNPLQGNFYRNYLFVCLFERMKERERQGETLHALVHGPDACNNQG